MLYLIFYIYLSRVYNYYDLVYDCLFNYSIDVDIFLNLKI